LTAANSAKPIMMTGPRYAIYFVPAPDTALYRFGAAALGYDCFTGADIATLKALPVDAGAWRDLTREPRRYGFHATLKAPFRLAEGRTEAELIGEFVEFSRTVDSVPTIEPAVRLLRRFVAIVPVAVGAALDRLAASCVKHFDGFRAPLSNADRSRRLAAQLTERQIGHMERWGYPYVFEDFRFHMTLTGALSADRQETMLAYLQDGLACSHGDAPIKIDRLALLRQDNPTARFVVLTHGAIS
jgi:putative phosphonate metabolism protein